jgi:hypothetical protein
MSKVKARDVVVVVDNETYSISLAFFKSVVEGRMQLSDLECINEIAPIMVYQWLEALGEQV